MHGASQVNSHYQILYVVLDGGRDTFLYYCGGRREQIRRALPRPIHYSLLPLLTRVVRVAALKRAALQAIRSNIDHHFAKVYPKLVRQQEPAAFCTT